ncbi:hypothetical protein DPMN_086028 [Dreissena polymorpha]|uniref:Uncharacterized protein n=1 Tax=Dreissena polymorpha TaxID=45954 RepID=A0A9D3YG45_DREPO|nr:hypothetical protein DPMN_086028 [Dreissena polymorpha]
MNRLGYGEEIRRWRVENYREFDRLLNACGSRGSRMTVGSKGEGLTSFYESDHDFLFELSEYLCVEDGINLLTIADDIEVYRMNTCAYPGHCILFLERPAHRRLTIIHNALCGNGRGDIILSSGLFVDEWKALDRRYPQYTCSEKIVHYERAGPSLPMSVGGVSYADRVLSLPCHCPSILQR